MTTRLCFQLLLTHFYLILFGVDSLLVSSRCQIDQQSILTQLKYNLPFNSSSSTKLVSWNPNATDCCTWGGVTCSTRGQVIGLDLSNETIYAFINDSSPLFGLQNLQRLNLAENSFRLTEIPSRFGSLKSLKYLNLSNAGFSGQIPAELSHLTRLEVLDLSSPFVSRSPTLILEKLNLVMLVRNLTRLRELYLDSVNMVAQQYDWCQGLSSSLPNLEVLSMSECGLSGPLDYSLEKLQSLSVINLAANDLNSPVPDSFANFRNLTVINLASCNLQGTFPMKVLQLQSLQILDVSSNTNLHGSLPDFPIHGSLQSLMLSNTNFSGEIPESIGNLKSLSRIELSMSNFSGQMPKSMENLTQLSYLDLSSNKFTGQLPSFQLCKNLTHIDLSQNSLSGSIPSTHFQDLQNLVSVDLGFNAFNGSIPASLFSLQQVQQLQLSNNNFDGTLTSFSNASASLLDTLDLSNNKLEGQIPRSFFELGRLKELLLSSNNLSGIIDANDFRGLSSIWRLHLSFNSLSIITSSNISILSELPMLYSLELAGCNLHKFPNLRNQSSLVYLDLSSNKIEGEIPNWIWRVGNGRLTRLNLSHNLLTGLPKLYPYSSLFFLDLHSNRLSGKIPLPPTTATYIDYSDNAFNLSLPENIGTSLVYFSASKNLLTGTIPDSICNATNLKVLDLSNNRLTGRIPQCLVEFGGSLGVLNLGNNTLSGQIEGIFPSSCSFNTLDLHGNSLEGKIPRSLINCTIIEVLNLGNNRINDTYPCFLGKNTNLRVLVLRSNKFHGSMHCGEDQTSKWSKLQILDIAHNSFGGTVPTDILWQWDTMMTVKDGEKTDTKYLSFRVFEFNDLHYQDTVTVSIKGRELELVKILTIFTSIDISNNQFSGEMPSTIGRLKAVYLLNVSHNAFTGSIPPSLGNLNHLESLDMSSNKLTGEIPSALTKLRFLSLLNLSYNQLEGKIPTGSQFQTFTEASYQGNKGLCGYPLNRSCPSSVIPVPSSIPSPGASSNEHDWQSIFYGMGVGAGLLIVISIMCSLRKRGTSVTRRQTNLSR